MFNLALAYVPDRPLNEGVIQKDNACYVGGLHKKCSTRRYILIGKEAVLKTAVGNCLGVRSSLPPLNITVLTAIKCSKDKPTPHGYAGSNPALPTSLNFIGR